MAISVTLFDEAGAPFPEGLGVELLHEGQVVAEARVDAGGTATFAIDHPGSLAVRLRADEAMSAARGEAEGQRRATALPS